MNKACLLILPLAFAVAGLATAADRPFSSAATRTITSSISIASPAYYYDFRTHSSGTVTTSTVSTSNIIVASTKSKSSNGGSKSTSSTGTKTTSTTGTTTTGTTTTGTTTTGTTTTGTTTFPAFAATTTIYAAIRTDGIAGLGTQQNPYDASTQAKFDAILAKLLKANGAQRTTLSLGAGTYTVTPVRVAPSTANPAGYVSNVPGNLEIIGAGQDKTIIRAGVVPTGSSTYWVFAFIGTLPGDYFENLTIDCNIQNQTASAVTIDGIQFLHIAGGATRTLASSIHIIDGGNRTNDAGDSEWFGVQLSDNQTGSVAAVTQCVVNQYQGSAGCTALSASDLITNNSVTLNNSDPDGFNGNGATGGFQNAYSPASTVSGNTCQNCTWGVYSDVDGLSGVDIVNNNFQTLYGGVWIYIWDANSTLNNIYVHNNTIAKTYYAAAIIGNPSTTVTNSNIFVYNNAVTTNVTSTLRYDNLVFITASRNSEVFGNTFSVVSSSLIQNTALNYSDYSTFAWYGNQFTNGTAIPGPVGTVTHALSGITAPPTN